MDGPGPAIDNEGEVSYDNGLSWKPVAECDGYTPGRGFDENSRGIRTDYEKTLERLRIAASATSAQNVGVVENGRMDFQQAQVSTKMSHLSLSLCPHKTMLH